jgi:hypothetical protein
MVGVKIRTSMPLPMSVGRRPVARRTREPVVLTRKNLKTNSLCGFPKARNQRETANKLINSSRLRESPMLLNRIPSVHLHRLR